MTRAVCDGFAQAGRQGLLESQGWRQVLVYFGEQGMRGSMSWMMLKKGEAPNAALRGSSCALSLLPEGRAPMRLR